MKVEIYCGETGCGKTTYVINKHPYACVFSGKDIIYYSTYEVIYHALPILRPTTSTKLYKKLIKEIEPHNIIIIDSAENINDESFDLIINAAISFPNKNVILTFDIARKQLFSSINFRKLIEKFDSALLDNITEFVCPDETINTWLRNNYPNISRTEYIKIINITNRNFKNMATLLWHKKIIDEDATVISEEVVYSYLNYYIEDKFKDLPSELLQILQQSSIIGKIFNKKILEDKKCFNIFGVSQYLKEIEEMRIFIKSHIDNNFYSFTSDETHMAIYSSIKPNIKKEWLQILLAYYYERLDSIKNQTELLSTLYRIKDIETIFGNREAIINLNLNLLSLYSSNKDIIKGLSIAEELFFGFTDRVHYGIKQFILLYLIVNYINEGMPEQVLALFNKIDSFDFYDGSFLYLDYYKAKCLYNMGKVDEAYELVQKLSYELQSTSADNFDQPIYSLVYSITATIENHLNTNDGGNHYYKLALNHSYNKLSDKSYFWDILKKCDMFFDYSLSKECLKKCIEYYSDEKSHNDYMLAEVYFNLGTEILFQEGNINELAKTYLTKAEKIFKNFPNERYAYSKNNLAIYYVLAEDNVKRALKTLRKALIVGLSHFTYMTIYLNICSCILLQDDYKSKQFDLAYKEFCKNWGAIKKRHHATKYEDIYKHILDLLIAEKCGDINTLIEKCSRLVDDESIDIFFKNIITDIYLRNTNHECIVHSGDNSFFYNNINSKKTFLAEFRFWE